MKKLTSLLLVVFMLSIMPFTVSADIPISVTIDGKAIEFDVQPSILNGRTLVPLRAIFESLGATVVWNDITQTVIATRQSTTIELCIGSPIMYVDGVAKMLDVPAMMMNNRTLVPVRAISEAFGVITNWNGQLNIVELITTKSISEYEAFEIAKKYIKENGIKNSASSTNIVYIYTMKTSDGELKAMYREKTDDLRFAFSVYNTNFEEKSHLTPSIILTLPNNRYYAEISSIIYYDMGIDHWSPKKNYKKSDISRVTNISLDNTTGYGIVAIPNNQRETVDSFTTQATILLLDSIDSLLSRTSISLYELGFINYQ